MKNKFNKLLSSIEYTDLEFFSYLLLLLWTISPIVEYILKNITPKYHTQYFVLSIYFIGATGIIEYIIYLYKKIKDKNFSIKNFIPQILLFILLILSIISSIYSDNIHLSFYGENYRKEGLIVYIMYLGFILSSTTITNQKYRKNTIKMIILSALFITILPLSNTNFSFQRFTNIYRNINHYGYFLMISSILSGFMFVKVNGSRKITYLIIYIFLTYILIRNNTFGCFLSISISLLFSLIYSLIKKYKRIDITILIITFILTSIIISRYEIIIDKKIEVKNAPDIVSNNITTFSQDIQILLTNKEKEKTNKIGNNRGLLWKEAWNYIQKKPIFGGGMESLKQYYYDHNIDMDRPHNIILQIAAFIGIPGAIVYIIFIIYLALTNLKYLTKDHNNLTIYVCTMCYFISSNFGNSMYYTSPYYMILLGFLISIKSIYLSKKSINYS